MKRLFSSGGGVQSTACLVLSAQGLIDFPVHIFANVGSNAESPETIAYVSEVLIPFAQKNGIEWVEVSKGIDLYDATMSSEKSIPIPVRMSGSGAPGSRSCTIDWKIGPISRYLSGLIPAEIHRKARATAKQSKIDAHGLPADRTKRLKSDAKKVVYDTYQIVLGKGISTDEIHRARTDSGFDFYRVNYPLIDLELSRADCLQIIKKAGLPAPPKSSCWFCPYTRFNRWQTMSTADPERFTKVVEMERALSDRAEKLGRGKTFFSDRGVRRKAFLDELVSDQLELFSGEDLNFCESGFCMT